jgi:hypothetical protein
MAVGVGVRSCVNLPTKLASRTVAGVREGIAEVFVDLLHVRPEVREGTKVVWGQTSALLEIVVAEKKIEVGYDWEHVWLGSRKVIHLTQSYLVKAGFDLKKSFVVEIGQGPGEVTACLPPAEILAVSPVGVVSYQDEEGWWNKLTEQDREGAMQKLSDEARRVASSSGLVQEAEERTGSRLTELARAKDIRLKLDSVSPPNAK